MSDEKRYCVGCAHFIYPPDWKHPKDCATGQMEERDRRITELERQVSSIQARLARIREIR